MEDVRASDAERDATVERLREAAAEGRLTLEELTDRIETAAGAVMRSDLVPLTADLPAAPVAGHPVAGPEIRGMGDIKRTGAWVVPAESSFRTWLGNITLDLREAQITAYETRSTPGSGWATSTCSFPRASTSRSARTRRSARSSTSRPRGSRARRASC